MLKQSLVASLVFATLLSPIYARAQELRIDAGTIISSENSLRSQLESSLNTKEAEQELEKIHVTKSEARMRLAGMTDAELAQVQQGVQRQVGGDVVVISASALLLIILLIVLLTR